MRVSLKAFQYFLAAVDSGSISAAADRLNVVPSAVSSAIDQVEQEFALKLVMRYRSRGIQPTPTGQILTAKIRHLLEEYSNLMSEGVELRTALTGSLRIGYYAPVAPAFMPDIVAPLIEGNPSVSVQLIECNNETAQSGLLNGEFDVILFAAENVKPGIAYETLLTIPPYILAPKGHPITQRQIASLADLAGVPLVLLDLPVASAYYRALLEEAGVEPLIVATASSTEMVRSLVASGIGCSVLNMRPHSTETYAGDVVAAVSLDPPATPLRFVLGHLEENPRRLVRAFVEHASTYFAGAGARRLTVTSAV